MKRKKIHFQQSLKALVITGQHTTEILFKYIFYTNNKKTLGVIIIIIVLKSNIQCTQRYEFSGLRTYSWLINFAEEFWCKVIKEAKGVC